LLDASACKLVATQDAAPYAALEVDSIPATRVGRNGVKSSLFDRLNAFVPSVESELLKPFFQFFINGAR
jgi:hypothetical protein